MFCHKCGTRAIENSVFCRKCGEKLTFDESQSAPKKEKAKSRIPLIFAGLFSLFIIVNIMNFAGNGTRDTSSPPPEPRTEDSTSQQTVGQYVAERIREIEQNFEESTHEQEEAPTPIPAPTPAPDGAPGNRFVIGETQIYYEGWGGPFEVTLENAEFVNRIGERVPESGNVFLRVEITLNNIGTGPSSFHSYYANAFYDDTYRFSRTWSYPASVLRFAALSPAQSMTLYFMFPESVAQSDRSLAIGFGALANRPNIEFLIRSPDSASASSRRNMANTTTGWQTVHTDLGSLILPPIWGYYYEDGFDEYGIFEGHNYLEIFSTAGEFIFSATRPNRWWF